ncbi:MAG: hypothetical protein ACRDU9_03290 [Acidimicrobiia bacterium]
MKTPLLMATSLLAALVWTAALIVDSDPFQSAPALLIGVGLVSMATVATVGMIVVSGRWARLLGFGAIGITVVLALVRAVDVIWVLGIVATAIATAALLSPAVDSSIRKLPAASGPPPRAVIPPLVLVSTPALLGLAGNQAKVWAVMVVGLSALAVALLYSRVFPGGLIGIRLLWPALALALSPILGYPAGLVAALLAIAVGAAAWGSSVKASYHPPREVGTTFPVPPELAPTEVLDAAEIDDTGKPR